MTTSFPVRVAAMLAGELTSKACMIAAFVWLARTLQPSVYGEAEWVLSVTMVFVLAADAGLSTWAASRIAADPQDAGTLVARVGWLRITLAVVAYSMLLIVAFSYGGSAAPALIVCGLVLFVTPLFLQYLFNGLLEPKWAAIGQALRGATFAAAVLLLARRGSSSSTVAIAELLGALILAFYNLAVLRAVFNLRVPLRAGRSNLRTLLSQSWPVGASELTWGVQWYAGLIILGLLAMTTEVAWYSAGLRLVLALHTIVWLYLYVLLPSMTRLIATDTEGWSRTLKQSVRVTAWIACGIAVAGTLGAEAILTTIFGQAFVAAVPALRIAIWVLPIAWASGHLRYSLIAAQLPRKEYHAAVIGAAVTAVATLILAPSLGSVGAALALLTGTAANYVAVIIIARRVLPKVALSRQLIAVAVCNAGCLALGVILLPRFGAVGSSIVAGAIVTTCFVVAERDSVRQILRTLTVALTMKEAPLNGNT